MARTKEVVCAVCNGTGLEQGVSHDTAQACPKCNGTPVKRVPVASAKRDKSVKDPSKVQSTTTNKTGGRKPAGTVEIQDDPKQQPKEVSPNINPSHENNPPAPSTKSSASGDKKVKPENPLA